MITHLEPDILNGEVKWALESITISKASGGDGIPVELESNFKFWAPRGFVTLRRAEKGRGQPAPRLASSAAAVGMETYTPRTGSQLA